MRTITIDNVDLRYLVNVLLRRAEDKRFSRRRRGRATEVCTKLIRVADRRASVIKVSAGT